MALKRWFLSCNEMKSRCYFDVLDDFLSQDDLGERREHCCSSVSISCRRCLAGSLFSFVFSGLFLLRLRRALHASTLPSGLSRVNASLQARSNTMQLCTFCVARVLSDTLVLIIISSNVLFLCECFFIILTQSEELLSCVNIWWFRTGWFSPPCKQPPSQSINGNLQHKYL